MLSGTFLMAVTVAFTILCCMILANKSESGITMRILERTVWEKMGITSQNLWILIMFKIILAALFGALWSLIGLVISIWSLNRYVTIIAPFVLFQLLWLGLEGSKFNPVYMLRGDSNYLPSFSFIIILQVLLISICYLVAYLGIKKRMKDN